MSDNNPWASPSGTADEPVNPGNQELPEGQGSPENPETSQPQGPSLSGRIISVTSGGEATADSSPETPTTGSDSGVSGSPSSEETRADNPENAGDANFGSTANGSVDAGNASDMNPAGSVFSQTNPAANPAANSGTNPGSDPSTKYGANAFWGTVPGFSDPLANQDSRPQNSNTNLPPQSPEMGANLLAGTGPFATTRGGGTPLQSSATWSSQTAGKREKNRPGWGALIGVAVVASLLSTGGLYLAERNGLVGNDRDAASSTLFNPEDKDVVTPEPVTNSNSQNPDWEAVAEAVRPAVVAISVETNTESDQGSGSIIDSKGHILTNNHVVAAAADGNGLITVELSDGRLYESEIVGRDVLTDLAVIKMKNPPKDLTVVALGDSDKLEVGESVAAIGNPLGLSSTVTTGIVSALDRPVRVEAVPGATDSQPEEADPFGLRRYFGGGSGSSSRPQENAAPIEVTTNAIQVDAAVNPGNSGGPLFDSKGRIVGVTSSIASLSSGDFNGSQAGSIGLGFAIPINQASMIATQLIDHGEAVHAALGVVVGQEVATVGEVSRLGASVQSVSPGSGADKAGIKKGDIIVEINGKPVKGTLSLVGFVRQYAVGDTVNLTIVRDGEEKKVSVTLQAQ